MCICPETDSYAHASKHVFRLFRVTSTTAVCMFRAVAKRNLPEDMLVYAPVLQFLGIQHNNFYALQNIDMETEELQDLSAETVESLMARKRDELHFQKLLFVVRLFTTR